MSTVNSELATLVETLLQSWTTEHSLTEAEQTRIRKVLEYPKATEADFHRELANVLAARRLAHKRLSHEKLLAYAREREAKLKAANAETQPE